MREDSLGSALDHRRAPTRRRAAFPARDPAVSVPARPGILPDAVRARRLGGVGGAFASSAGFHRADPPPRTFPAPNPARNRSRSSFADTTVAGPEAGRGQRAGRIRRAATLPRPGSRTTRADRRGGRVGAATATSFIGRRRRTSYVWKVACRTARRRKVLRGVCVPPTLASLIHRRYKEPSRSPSRRIQREAATMLSTAVLRPDATVTLYVTSANEVIVIDAQDARWARRLSEQFAPKTSSPVQ